MNPSQQNTGLDAAAAQRRRSRAIARPEQWSRYIDHTLLKPDATEEQIATLCEEAVQSYFASVCVNPGWIRFCAQRLQGSEIIVCGVVGFPLGATSTEAKAHEAKYALMDGAREIDMVLNIGFLKSGLDSRVLRDISEVAAVAHDADALLKVIIEASLLSIDEKERACLLSREAGADFVKTATGFGPGGATVEDVALMRRVVGNELGVKASGGIRDLATAEAMLAAGANRLGTSAGIKIMAERRAAAG
jgi:deoxyribose-phosphate aldolase